ncbi:MAG: alpha-amylase family protein [Ilumatobacteraceae bacterium]
MTSSDERVVASLDEGELRITARAEYWRPYLREVLGALYGGRCDVDELVSRAVAIASDGARHRRPSLRALDVERETDPAWFQDPSMIGYVAYAELFGGTLKGVEQRLEYLADLHVRYFHLMKVLRARDGANDGGYAVLDYRDVDPALGTWADLEHLADALHQRGISLCLDLVMNHTAREHEWARKAKAGSARHRDYYLVYPDRTEPDRYEATLPEVFPEMAPGNFTWDDDLSAWVWTTFNAYQWDLNYANPEVLLEMLQIMVDLANAGVDVLRLDAVAFTWKRLGTNCQNQPEAHLIAQAYRALMAIAAPATLLKAEAIVAPSDLLPYLGVHRLERPECHLAYHNQLMVMLWSSLAAGDAALASTAMAALPATPASAGWVNYVRCHDDIGWAVSDADAEAAHLDGFAHRTYLAAFYRGDFRGSFSDGVPFSSNPDAGDERTCGSAAALCGVGRAVRGGDPVAIDLAMRRLELVYGVMFGFPGVPLVYMGDEIALDNDRTYLDDPEKAEDSRWIHRPSMPWNIAARRTVQGSAEHRMYSTVQRMVSVRRSTPAMAAGGDTWIHRYDDTAVFAWARRHQRHGRFFGLANFALRPASVPTTALEWAGLEQPRAVFGEQNVRDTAHGLELAPLSVVWFADDADRTLA